MKLSVKNEYIKIYLALIVTTIPTHHLKNYRWWKKTWLLPVRTNNQDIKENIQLAIKSYVLRLFPQMADPYITEIEPINYRISTTVRYKIHFLDNKTLEAHQMTFEAYI